MTRKKMYYLTTTAKRKNAKRHIVRKSEDINYLKRLGRNVSERYIVEIYNGKWELVETIK